MDAPPVSAGAALPTAGWPGLDLVRFLCVVFMILIHAFFWLATQDGLMLLDPDGLVMRVLPIGMVVGFFPLMLPFSAGCSLRLSLGGKAELPALPWGQVGRMIGTGALLAAVGFLMNYFASGLSVLGAWNVLQTVGLSIACTAFLVRKGKIWPLILAGVAAVLVAAPLRAWLLVPPVSDGGAGVFPGQGALWAWSDWYATKALIGDPTGFHVWPFLPWFGTVAAGFGFAHVYLVAGPRGAAFRWGMLAVSAVLIAAAALSGELVPRFSSVDLIGSSLFLASPGFIAGVLGVAIGFTTVSTRLLAGRRFAPTGFVSCLSRGILWVYFIHTLVGGWLAARLLPTVDRAELFRQPLAPNHLAVLLGFPALLLGVGWLAGWLAVHGLEGKRLRITLRKVPRGA